MNFGIIGNCKTAAIVNKQASIQWCCFPRFDSPSVFGRLLDESKGGSLDITPVGNYKIFQRYITNTNILETRFYRERDEFVVYDFFPRFRSGEKIEKLNQIHRYIRVIRGAPKITINFDPKFDYARCKTNVRRSFGHITASCKEEKIRLYSDLEIDKIFEKKPIELSNEHYIVVTYNEHIEATLEYVQILFNKTDIYWREYVNFSSLPEFESANVIRSVLALKLLTHESGSVVAAATTSLPETIGSNRNWDYRYCWLRDSSFTIDAFTKLCHFDEAEDYIEWITNICLKDEEIQIMYRVDGDKNLPEKELSHLSGYKDSKPVRIGNGAYQQKQLDVYGEILDTLYLYFVHYNYAEIQDKHWQVVKKLVDEAIADWDKKDHGLWEIRDTKKHYTFSKLLMWVALDRGAKIAHSKGETNFEKQWKDISAKMKEEILANAWNEKVQAFTQSYGSEYLDASNLLMPYFGFLSAKDPRMLKTIRATQRFLSKDGFLLRYINHDGLGVPDNVFILCTFWLIDSLYLAGEKNEAKKLFDKIMSKSNHVGLFAEHLDSKTNELTGNFPQAYTHLAIINTATLLGNGSFRRPKCNIRMEMLKN